MKSIDEAVSLAWQYCSMLYKNKNISDLTLEEIELEEGKYWLITLSYNVPESGVSISTGPTGSIFSPPKFRRVYKVFKISGDTGKVISMKIRKI